MKFTTVLAVLAAFAATAAAETNAERLARGMSPLPPVRRLASRTTDAADHKPSGKPPPPSSTCSTGPVQCCNSVSSSSNPDTRNIIKELGLYVPSGDIPIGLHCSPLGALAGRDLSARGNSCSAQTVCCENDHFNGLIAIGCMPININL